MGPEGVLVENVAGTEHQTRCDIFTKPGKSCAAKNLRRTET